MKREFSRTELVGFAVLAVLAIIASIQTFRVQSLQSQVEELELGAERSLAKAADAVAKHDFLGAIEILSVASKRHPELSQEKRFSALLKEAKSRLATAEEEKRKANERQIAEQRRAAEQKRLEAQNKGLVAWDNALTKQVPIDFKGSDIKSIHAILSQSLPRGKDQYETEKDYQERMSDHFKKVRFGTFEADTSFVFSAATSLVTLQYNAEKKLFTVDLGQSVTVEFESSDAGSYVGQNAFGVRKDISRRANVSYGLNIPNYKSFVTCHRESYGYCFSGDVGTFPLSAEAAREEEGKFKALYVIKLAPPFASEETSTTKPTIDNPYEISSTSYTVHGQLVGFVIYSSRTGKVFFQSVK